MNDKKDVRVKAQKLKGFRDYPPVLMAARWRVMDIVRAEAALAGFQAVGTPALEYAATLLGQGGDETDKQVYRFKDNGDRDVALRFDLTVPFARFVAEHLNELPMPFKRVQIGDVWRGENTQKGRYREFCQCDIDIIGVDSLTADVEVLSTFHRIMSQLPTGGFNIRVGNRLVLSAMIRKALGALPDGAETSALIALDKLDKIGPDKVSALLAAIPGVSADGPAKLLSLLALKSGKHSDLAAVKTFLGDDAAAQAQLERFERTISMVTCTADLSIARGLGYYTGIVFETTLAALPSFGSVGSGGRYNNLAARFSNRDLPGVGGSVGLDRITAAFEEMGTLVTLAGNAGPKAFVAIATEDAIEYAFSIVEQLRCAGIATDIGMSAKLGNQFKQADRLGAQLVVTVGTSEMLNKTCALKLLTSGHETRDVSIVGIADAVQQLLNN